MKRDRTNASLRPSGSRPNDPVPADGAEAGARHSGSAPSNDAAPGFLERAPAADDLARCAQLIEEIAALLYRKDGRFTAKIMLVALGSIAAQLAVHMERTGGGPIDEFRPWFDNLLTGEITHHQALPPHPLVYAAPSGNA